MVTAMDVFEHLTDPPGAAEQLWAALKPGGFLLPGLPQSPMRTVHSISSRTSSLPERLRSLGLIEVGATSGSGDTKYFKM